MPSSIQKRAAKPIIATLEKAVVPALAVGTALTLDHLAGSRRAATRRPNPEFYTAAPKGARHTLGVLPGCRQNGEVIFKRLQKAFPQDNLVVVDYQQKDFDTEQLCEKFIKKLQEVGAEEPDMYCPSMGGMVLNHLLNFADATGTVNSIGGFGDIKLDSPPFDWADVQPSKHTLAIGAAIFQRSFVLDEISHPFIPDSYGLSETTTLAMMANSTKWMKHTQHPLFIPRIYRSMEYHAAQGEDGTILRQQAFAKYVTATQGAITWNEDAWRPGNQHVDEPVHFVQEAYAVAA